MTNPDTNLQIIRQIEEIIVETQMAIKRTTPLQLGDKIVVAARLKTAQDLLTSLKGVPATLIKEETLVEKPAVPQDIAMAITARDQLSAEIRVAMNKMTDLKRVLSNAIPGKVSDRTITNVSASPRPGQKVQNMFTNQYEYIELVFCTNSDAYVVSRSDKDIFGVSNAKYWKVPELTTG